MSNFVSYDFKNYIDKLIRNNVLTNLNLDEYQIILDLLIKTINHIAIRFNFDLLKADDYVHQFKQNNNRDIYAILNLLLPFIDDYGGTFSLHKEIYDLKDVSVKKVPNNKVINGFIKSNMDPNDNITKNPYLITNLQFNRNTENINYLLYLLEGSRGKLDIHDENLQITHNNKYNYFFEYEFNKYDLYNNFYLLLNTIDQISNKLYINWINIRPITDYKNSSLYKKSFKYTKKEDKYKVLIDGVDIDFNWYNHTGFNTAENEYIRNDKVEYYQGLSCGDYYNMLHHELYFGIKEYKWLIYDLPDDGNYKDIPTYWELFKFHFKDIDKFLLNNDEFIYIEETNSKIIGEWTETKNKLASTIQNNNENKILLYNILYFFERKYSQRYLLKEYKNLSKKQEIDDDILEEIEEYDYHDIKNKNIIVSWESLTLNHLYNYILEVISKFKKTWYGYNILIKKNKYPFVGEQEDSVNFTYIERDENRQFRNNVIKKHIISYKNIYNFAQSILLYTYEINEKNEKKEKKYLKHYRKYTWYHLGTTNSNEPHNEKMKRIEKNFRHKHFLLAQKSLFIDAMTVSKDDDKVNYIFNINGVLQKKYGKSNIRNIDMLTKEIYSTIRENLTNVIFECLFIRGLLNEFVTDKECTDKAILSNDFDIKKARTKYAVKKNIFNSENIEKYKECYYYLTDEPYKNLQIITKKNEPNLTYFENLTDDTWYTFYAMDWIAQIGFFHRYINNRIIYVTGATGAGKSTQIPKLLLYGLKMIEFNKYGKVVSTQPRVSPTMSNAKEISEQMGVPISGYSAKLEKEVKTFSNYVQYKTQKQAHLGKSAEYFFKEMTDGSLVNELHKNPLLKKLIVREKDEIYNDTLEFSLENEYDIVVIDESHEHNKNMDIILTLMKYATYWNNSLKTVIISATMDDDEPIYRRYYKNINDNMMYPLNLHNISNIFFTDFEDNKYCRLDRISVDRRFHISSPGETTQHKVVDHYLEVDTNSYEEAEKKGLEKLYELIDNKATGDILFFTVTENNIKSLVTNINQKIPSNVIALPFYGKLPEYWKDLAEKTNKIKFFDIKRDDLFKEIDNPGSGNKVSPGTYTQVIVVATNVAEASITIVNLRHVIETGYYNSVTYDNLTKLNNVEIAPITEASRLQRRGRVGRVAGGDVWHMYVKGARSEIKPSYNICVSNINMDMFKMLRKSCKEDFLIDINYDINNAYDLIIYEKKFFEDDIDNYDFNIITQNIDGYDQIYKKIEKPKNYNEKTFKCIQEMMFEQYLFHLLNGVKYNVIYLGDSNLRPKLAIDVKSFLYRPHHRYLTGYDVSSIIDLYGTFHLIHPAENLCRRHILLGLIDNYTNNLINKFDRNFVIKSFRMITNLYFSRLIIPSKPLLKFDMTLESRKIDDLLSYENNTEKIKYSTFALVGQYDEIIADDNIKYKLTMINNSEKYYKNNTNDIFDKTTFAHKINSFFDKLEITDADKIDDSVKLSCVIAIIYGLILGIENEICKVVAMLFTFGFEMKSYLPLININGFNKPDFKKSPFDRCRNNNSDLITIYNLFNLLNTELPYLSIWNKSQQNEQIDVKINELYKKEKIAYLNIKKEILKVDENIINNKTNIWNKLYNQDITFEQFENIQKFDQKFALDDELSIKEYKTNYKNKIKKTMDYDLDIIVLWCANNNIDINNMYKTIKMFISLKNKLVENEKHTEWFKNNINISKESNLNDNIVKCFLFGFIENIMVNNNNIFTEILTKIQNELPIISPKFKLYDTLTIPSKYCFYLKKEKNGIMNINNVSLNWIIEFIPDIINKYSLPSLNQHNENINSYIDIINEFKLINFDYKIKEKDYNNLVDYFESFYNLFTSKLI